MDVHTYTYIYKSRENIYIYVYIYNQKGKESWGHNPAHSNSKFIEFS